MVEPSVTVPVIFTVIFSLFFLSNARIQLTRPSNLVTEYKPSTTSSESDNKDGRFKSNRLPISRSESESHTNTISAIGIARPLTTACDVNFHPINLPPSFRFPHPICRHQRRRVVFGRRKVSYGNDMIDRTGVMNTDKVYGDTLSVSGFQKHGHVDGGKRFRWVGVEHVKKLKMKKKGGKQGALFEKVRKFIKNFV